MISNCMAISKSAYTKIKIEEINNELNVIKLKLRYADDTEEKVYLQQRHDELHDQMIEHFNMLVDSLESDIEALDLKCREYEVNNRLREVSNNRYIK